VGGAAGYDRSKGLAGNNATEGQQALKSVALWKPGESRWRTGPAQAKWRSYHSTAVLLPDGRVLSAGDDFWNFDDVPAQGTAPSGQPQDRGEIYEPAYLFDGDEPAPRPRITSGPSAVRWGSPFGVGTDEARGRRIVRATLVAPDAVTHAVNMNRVFAELPIARVPGRGVDVLAPVDANRAPPGWYMLFLWDETGTPTVSRWIQLRADAPDAPVLGTGVFPEPGGGSGGGGGAGGGSAGDGGVGDGSAGGGGSTGGGGGVDGGAAGDGGPDDAGGTNGAPATGAPRPAPAAADRRGPRAAVAVRRVTHEAKRLRIRVGADEPGRLALRVRAAGGRERTRAVRLTPRRLATTVTVPLDRKSRRTLRAGRALRVVLRTTATDAAGNAARRTVVVRLRPARR
jgi:hypothetical protein